MSEQIIGNKIIYYDVIPSTNTCATNLLKHKRPPEGTIISAKQQTAGRGHGANKWESKRDKNLTISIVLYPVFLKADEQFLLSMAISLGIKDFLELFTENIYIKWPNDIYVSDDKIAGILIENSISGNNFDYCVAGIGININQEKFTEDASNPISLIQITGRKHSLDDALNLLCRQLDFRYNQLKEVKNRQSIKANYLNNLYHYQEFVQFEHENKKFTAKITGIDPSGRLIIRHKNGETEIFGFHEVSFA
ncbi:MAG: biotin--[acetyl-CoA-carboxylase] ligase, partial [Bacteroidetes bacterium]|nr:biotin--[acetyl-CoA-carboxylase] ligase [Bacteroidota bacterium]